MLKSTLFPHIAPDSLRGRKGFPYHASPGLLAALQVGLQLERPLLLTGEPGSGKTDFSWAIARALQEQYGYEKALGSPLQCYVRSDTNATQLLYSYDALARFSDAHHGGASGSSRAQDAHNYITLEGLGSALVSEFRRVVLIDEIDKAPRDLPNDLLRELDQLSFDIRELPPDRVGTLRRTMSRPLGKDGSPVPAPLIIITSNAERQLPEPFLRRCVFWHITFPLNEIEKILLEHEPELRGVSKSIVSIVRFMREIPEIRKKPSTSELLDWASALIGVYDFGSMERQIRRFGSLAEQRVRDTAWGELPALPCLLKTSPDFFALCGG